ncbi:MAG TPA: LysR family transcriptional regulator [Paracoccaceae bacterium]|nr:LysR family transcriptional regulator [Paracoccaceae bacterium]
MTVINMRIEGPETARSEPLGRLRLLVALDALLVEGSVGRAGARLGLGAPAMSRLLAQLREHYGDPLLVRTGRGMAPTPLAEGLRQRVRALATEAEALLSCDPGEPLVTAPPLGFRPDVALPETPRPEDLSRRLAAIGGDAAPARRLARHIAMVGGGTGRSRPLTPEEAEDAFATVLGGEAHPVQIGALMLALQQRPVTAGVLAGLVRAARAGAGAPPPGGGRADLDWPAYLSPRVGAAPWFLHAARLVAQAGYRVLVHGQSGGIAEMAARHAGLPVAGSADEAKGVLGNARLAFVPLEAFAPQMQRLFGIYRLLEMRSVVHLVAPLLNPCGAPASVLGVSGLSCRGLHLDTAALLGWPRMTVAARSRDVAQIVPFRASELLRMTGGAVETIPVPPVPEPRPEPRVGMTRLEYWQAVWNGAARDARAEEIILWTTAAALLTLDPRVVDLATARDMAGVLWRGRG